MFVLNTFFFHTKRFPNKTKQLSFIQKSSLKSLQNQTHARTHTNNQKKYNDNESKHKNAFTQASNYAYNLQTSHTSSHQNHLYPFIFIIICVIFPFTSTTIIIIIITIHFIIIIFIFICSLLNFITIMF